MTIDIMIISYNNRTVLYASYRNNNTNKKSSSVFATVFARRATTCRRLRRSSSGSRRISEITILFDALANIGIRGIIYIGAHREQKTEEPNDTAPDDYITA